jgi:hypothetical protein
VLHSSSVFYPQHLRFIDTFLASYQIFQSLVGFRGPFPSPRDSGATHSGLAVRVRRAKGSFLAGSRIPKRNQLCDGTPFGANGFSFSFGWPFLLCSTKGSFFKSGCLENLPNDTHATSKSSNCNYEYCIVISSNSSGVDCTWFSKARKAA